MIEDPDFTKIPQTHENLIEFGVVRDGVEVRPVRIAALPGDHVEIDVHTFRVSCDLSKVRFVLVVVLDEMIPKMPFPNHFAARLASRFDLDQAVRPNFRFINTRWHAAGPPGLSGGFLFLHKHQDVAIRQPREIVMWKPVSGRIGEIPDQFAIPIKFLNPAAPASDSATIWRIRLRAGPQQMAVLE